VRTRRRAVPAARPEQRPRGPHGHIHQRRLRSLRRRLPGPVSMTPVRAGPPPPGFTRPACPALATPGPVRAPSTGGDLQPSPALARRGRGPEPVRGSRPALSIGHGPV